MTAGPSFPAGASARRQTEGSQPLMNRRDLNRRLEPNRKFVEPGRHGPVLLETADPAFDRVPGLAPRSRSGPARTADCHRAASGDQQRQRLLSLLTRQMNLRGEPASRPAQSMVFRFGAHSARRFLLHSTALAGTGSMPVCPADGGVDIDLPEDQPGRISPRLQQREQPGPHTPTLPSPEQSIHRLPRSVLKRQVPPRNSGPNPPPHTVYQPPTARPPATYAHRRQQRLQHRPLLISSIRSIGGNRCASLPPALA